MNSENDNDAVPEMLNPEHWVRNLTRDGYELDAVHLAGATGDVTLIFKRQRAS